LENLNKPEFEKLEFLWRFDWCTSSAAHRSTHSHGVCACQFLEKG